MEGADYMYYDKDEYTTDVNWYTDLITESLGEKWRPIRGNENSMHINKISAKKQNGCNAQQACAEETNSRSAPQIVPGIRLYKNKS